MKPSRKELLSEETKPIDVEKKVSVGGLVEEFKDASFQARNIGLCEQVFENMLTDEDRPVVMLGLSGSLIAAGLRKVIRDMIANKLVDVVVSTGAILYQDFYQARGYKHYKGSPDADDVLLRDYYIDRLYDTYVDEKKFQETDYYIGGILEKLEPRDYSTREFLSVLGKEANDENSILFQAWKNGVPVYCPALCDSSIGIGLTTYYAKTAGKKFFERPTIDMIRDNYEFLQIVSKAKKTAAIYVGGGTPKNWINDAVVMANYTQGREFGGHAYIFQVTVDSPQWGGLSGSTLKEAQSWGKVARNATKATAYVEASVAMPLIIGAVLEKNLHEARKRLKFVWSDNKLASLQ